MKKSHLIILAVAAIVAGVSAYVVKLNRESDANADEKLKEFAQKRDIMTLFLVFAAIGVAAGFIIDKSVKTDTLVSRRSQQA